MATKESSIEWLMVKIHTTDWVNNTREEKLEIFEQAKEMHKQEIIKALQIGYYDGMSCSDPHYTSPYKKWNDYYNETFVE